MSTKFKKTVENFTCSFCGAKVKGTGYTDHCPNCLWSKHVDIYPGDRNSKCNGDMEPIGVEIIGNTTKILYRCRKCKHEHKVETSKDDNPDAILLLSTL